MSLFSTTRKASRMKPCGLLSLRVELSSLPRVTRLRSVTLFSRMMERRAYAVYYTPIAVYKRQEC